MRQPPPPVSRRCRPQVKTRVERDVYWGKGGGVFGWEIYLAHRSQVAKTMSLLEAAYIARSMAEFTNHGKIGAKLRETATPVLNIQLDTFTLWYLMDIPFIMELWTSVHVKVQHHPPSTQTKTC